MSADPSVETHDWVMARADEMMARGATQPRLALDPVNQPQINTWLDAIGDPDPRWTEGEAPPAMAQVWTMPGLGGRRSDDDPLHGMMTVLDRAGYTSVLGTNCDQAYERTLRVGERVSIATELESVVGPKHTGVGDGYFVTTRAIWRVGDEQVATMLFRVLKFKPAQRVSTGPDLTDPSRTVRPMVNRDNEFFFEGTAKEELRVQQCNACGLLRHPPGPVCPSCHAMDRGWVTVAGSGRLYSYTEHHAPQIPGKKLPLLIGVVELGEGVRMIGELRGVPRDDVEIGMPLQVGYDRVDDDLTLAYWQPVHDSHGAADPHAVSSSSTGASSTSFRSDLPTWELPVTTTLVVSTALATRDFQDVHHDRDLARSHGSKDIFLNILTTTGLVQRYVGEWAGPGAVVRSCELRLGAPAYPGDTLSFAGTIESEQVVDRGRRLTVRVVGTVPLGSHVTARLTLDAGATG